VVQEAMTYGLPAIAVAGGGASSSIIDGVNGFIVKNDPDAFAQMALAVLHNDVLHARLSEQALRSVRNQGVTQMCDQVVSVYRSVIQRNLEITKHASYAWVEARD
jgi:glycosyltransferase involved in cell wall biosynthesis